MIETSTDFVSLLASIPDFAHIVRAYQAATPEIKEVYLRLVEPMLAALSSGVSSSLIFDRAGIDTPLYKQAMEIMNYAYSSRFTLDHRWLEFDDPLTNSEITVIRLDTDVPFVIATQRLAWGSGIDVFELFNVPPEALPQEGIPGNVGRFALNPIFDAIFASRDELDPRYITRLDAFRTDLFRWITTYCFELLDERHVSEIYTICHAGIRAWMSKAGVHFREVQGVQMVNNDTVRQIQSLYPRYWEKSPGVFIAELS